MTEELVLKLGQDAIKTGIMIASPMLLAALAIGLVISVMQAVTQINEATLTFIPKMVVIFAVVLIASVLSLAEGYGLLTGKRWARPLGFALGILSLFDIPIGTIIGVYTIVILWQKESRPVLTQ